MELSDEQIKDLKFSILFEILDNTIINFTECGKEDGRLIDDPNELADSIFEKIKGILEG